MHTFEKTASGWQLVLVSGLTTLPSARFFHTAVHDRSADTVLIYGGTSNNLPFWRKDLWALDGSLSFQYVSDGPFRWAHSAAWAGPRDGSSAGPMLVFGGRNDAYATLGELWEVVSGTWSQVNAGNGPAARAYHTSVFAESLGQNGLMLVFGGGGHDDLWAYDHGVRSWSQLSAGPAGIGRALASAVWNPTQQAMLVCGGKDSSYASSYAGPDLLLEPWLQR